MATNELRGNGAPERTDHHNLVAWHQRPLGRTSGPRTHAAFLVCQAQNDDATNPKVKDDLKAAFTAAGKRATVEVYAANHGWCVPGGQVYNQAEAERAWSNLTTLYKTNLV